MTYKELKVLTETDEGISSLLEYIQYILRDNSDMKKELNNLKYAK